MSENICYPNKNDGGASLSAFRLTCHKACVSVQKNQIFRRTPMDVFLK